MNSLIISRLSGGMETIDSLKSYKLSETADWLAYQRGSKKDSMLYIRSLDGMQQDSFPAVSDFGFAQKGNVLYVVSDSVLYTYIPQKGNNRISDKKGVFKKIAFNENGSKLAYLFCPHKDSAATRSSLYLAENNTPGKLIAERGDKAFPASSELLRSPNRKTRPFWLRIARMYRYGAGMKRYNTRNSPLTKRPI